MCSQAAPKTVLAINARLVQELDSAHEHLSQVLHKDYRLSGVMVPYAIPPYTRPTNRMALVRWQREQDAIDACDDPLAINDGNCRLALAKWVNRNKIPHRKYKSLMGIITKFTPLETCFPKEGKQAPGAIFHRMVTTRKALEEGMDRLIEKRLQTEFWTHRVPVFALELEAGGPDLPFPCRDILQSLASLVKRIDPKSLLFRRKLGPPWGEYITSRQYDAMYKRCRRDHPNRSTRTGELGCLHMPMGTWLHFIMIPYGPWHMLLTSTHGYASTW